MDSELVKAAQLLGIELTGLKKAAKYSEQIIKDYRQCLREVLQEILETGQRKHLEKTDVVLLGSIARRESTVGSDCDYYILQNGAPPEVTQNLTLAMEQIRQRLEPTEPGVQGIFGNIVIAANLYETIGLEGDTNVNMTRRVLLLTESEPISSGRTHRAVIDNILAIYCADYLGSDRKSKRPAEVPRYLLNDIVRFWRTMAVDFGTKRWRTIADDSHLRLAKLRVSRKVLFAGPLATILLVPIRVNRNSELKLYLTRCLRRPPLAQIASTAAFLSRKSQDALKKLLTNYDEFIGLLSTDSRDILQDPQKDNKRFEKLRIKCEKIGDTVQKLLEIIFYDDPLFKATFRKYAVF